MHDAVASPDEDNSPPSPMDDQTGLRLRATEAVPRLDVVAGASAQRLPRGAAAVVILALSGVTWLALWQLVAWLF